jgi:dTDP-4-dehydrorhamnose 3,5-epimerase
LQNPYLQGKLVAVLKGEIFDAAVDIRVDSLAFGRWVRVTHAAESKPQFCVPIGFAHDYVVTSDTMPFSYKCSDYYQPQTGGASC